MTTPTLPITSANRGDARKFLTAHGYSGNDVRTMTIRDLNANVKLIMNQLEQQPKTSDDLYLDSIGGRDAAIRWLYLETDSLWTADELRAFGTHELAELHRIHYSEWIKNQEPAEVKAEPIPEPTPKTPETKMTNPAIAPEQLAALSTLLSSLVPAQQIDESKIIELIKQHAARPTAITITQNGETRRVEGAHHEKTPLLIKVLSTTIGGKRPSAWLAGPAGSGKTTAAEQVALALDLPFYSTGAIQTEYKLTGFINAEGEIVRTPFREAFEHGGVFLWDEIDGSNPNALVAFNQALANGSFAFPDKMVKKHEDFIAIAAANTYGSGATVQYVGRNRIDAATLDRFIFIEWNYDEELEKQIANGDSWVAVVQAFRKAVNELNIRHIVSPRASIDGAGLLAAGLSAKEVKEMVIRKGLELDQWQKLEAKAKQISAAA